ncbi:DUF1766-domain-containing protein [Gigaspora margarita]|uniref:DUF1766-domain-containing protein n=1 Tax=Gigaspora margarita TaxID=4874 RepID=A0A8H4EK98_GIGMA|nr:DUF1766-domain-containing protein [Gigaspora margarita]
MPPKNDYPLKLSGEELNGKEKKLYRLSGKYFEAYQKWSINSFLDYLNNKGRSHKFPLIVKKEIFTSWLEKKLECGEINVQVYLSLLRETKKKKSDAISSRTLIKTGKPCANYINFNDYTEEDVSNQTEETLRIEIIKDISLYDEPGYIFIYKVKDKQSGHLYKIGKTKSVGRRLDQLKKKCHFNAELVKILPEGRKCKYTHRTERLIHIELEVHRIDLLCDCCKQKQNEWFKSKKKVVCSIVKKWVCFMEKACGFDE